MARVRNINHLYEKAHEYLSYEGETGYLFWKKRPGHNHVKIGDSAHTLSHGRISIGFANERHFAHRIIFLMAHGYCPKVIDHIDLNPLNNRLDNLRAATHTLNNANMPKRKNTSSKYKGVNFHKHHGTWQAQIRKDGKYTALGSYKLEIEAAAAYDKAAKEIFGSFARINGVAI